MRKYLSQGKRRGFTLIELLVVALILGIIISIVLPSYLTAVIDSREGMANANSLALAKAVQAKALNTGAYDTVLSDYANDLGGVLPLNPCTGTNTGYLVSASGNSATVTAAVGSNCGTWAPIVFMLSQ